MKPLVGRLVINSKCTTQYTAHVNSKSQIFPPSFSTKVQTNPLHYLKDQSISVLSPGNGIGIFSIFFATCLLCCTYFVIIPCTIFLPLRILEYDLNLHMQRLHMPFFNQPFYNPPPNSSSAKPLDIENLVISLGDPCLHPEKIILIHKNAEFLVSIWNLHPLWGLPALQCSEVSFQYLPILLQIILLPISCFSSRSFWWITASI